MKRWPVAAAGLLVFGATLVGAPAAALAGWRAAFVALGVVPVGAVTLLLIARLTGAAWDAALQPLLRPLPWLLPAFVPVVIHQALVVPRPAHLAVWLSWPAFLLRGLVAIGLWWGLGRLVRQGGPSPLVAGLGLVAHGIVLTIVGTDWLLGSSPGQPQSAIAMVMTTMALLGACGSACLLRLGPDRARRDLSFLLLAAALGLAYLLFMDFLIVWFGNLPTRVGWYVTRTRFPWVALPTVALLVGLFGPILGIGLVRTDRGRQAAGAGALLALLAVGLWFCGPPAAGWAILAAIGAAVLGASAAPEQPA